MSEFWRATARVLAEAGVRAVVGLPTDEVGLLDVAPQEHLSTVTVSDQRTGACLATAYALVSGRPTVLAVSSGPAVANALVGLAEAASVCAPVLVITTRIDTAQIGRGGFQESDQRSLLHSISKWHFVLRSVEQLPWAVRRALQFSLDDRPGVCVLEVTSDVAAALAAGPTPESTNPSLPVMKRLTSPDPQSLEMAAAVLSAAHRPLVVLGSGAKAAKAGQAALALAARLGAPVFTTASGRGAISEADPSAIGLVGLYTTPPLHTVTDEADVVLLVGSRFEETARMGCGNWHDKHFVQVDVDTSSIGMFIEPRATVLGDASRVLRDLAHLLPDAPARTPWIARWKGLQRAARGLLASDSLSARVVRDVGAAYGENANYVHENGLHDIWSFHYPLLPIGPLSNDISPGEQTMMGFGMGAALGAALAAPDRPTILFAGDSAIALSMSTFINTAANNVPLAVVVFDNDGFGWPRRLRHVGGHSADITALASAAAVDAAAEATGWLVLQAGALIAGVSEAVEQMRSAHSSNRSVLLRVRVNDSDIPPGVQRLELLEAQASADVA